MTALSILGLVSSPPGRIVGGRIEFMGRDLLELDSRAMRRVRGAQISIIFQDPLTSLNPVKTVGFQIAEVFRFHRGMSRVRRLPEVLRMLRATEIPAADERAEAVPARAERGPAAAGHDRHGARLRARRC